MRAPAIVVLLSLAACASRPAPPTRPSDPAARVVHSLLPVVHVAGSPRETFALDSRMAHYKVPGVSIAVVEDGRLAWARGFGVKQAGRAGAVTETTLFQAASISKPVTATATLRLVDRGELSLDADVNTVLSSWKVPENPFTVSEKVTLRRILSHTAGTNVHGFPGYVAGAPLPTLVQILDGRSPANTAPIRVVAVPGSGPRYSGGGVMIEQLVLVDHTHLDFPALMQELVLAPAGMSRSTFEQPLSAARYADAATAHDNSGHAIPGAAHVYPEMAAAGLWSTPIDLLAWARAITASRAGNNGVLTSATAAQMLAVGNSPFGLGPTVEGRGRALHFGHQGEDEGFLSELVYFPETGQGAAVMVNGGGRALIREVLYAISSEYRWPGLAPEELTSVSLPASEQDRIVGTYDATYEVYRIGITVHREGARLVLTSPRLGIDSEIVFTSPTSFVAKDGGEPFLVVVDSIRDVAGLDFGGLQLLKRP